ncbi:MAG: menaquinone biosynthesis protein [candidate division NC10 bacterium]|nr:menaquinone biosynthesis protein [candidate division NC10 bacterium]
MRLEVGLQGEAALKVDRRPRVGRVRYLNCEPVYYAIEQGIVKAPCEIVDGTPTELNKLLREGKLDLSVISALEYARHPDLYLLLPDLAIACDGPVESVLFLSLVPFQALAGTKVLLTTTSLTSRALIRLLLDKRYRVTPTFIEGIPPSHLELSPETVGVLLIGDEALKAKASKAFPYILDLGACWKELTDLPCVFAVWAVRREFYAANPEETHRLHRALLASKAWSLDNLERIAKEVHGRVGLTERACLDYLRKRLSFDLSPRHLEGLRRFLQMLEAAGELKTPKDFSFIESQGV